jgi:uncharacterized protein
MTRLPPLLTLETQQALLAVPEDDPRPVLCSLDLGVSRTEVQRVGDAWVWQGQHFPFVERCRERTVYHWSEGRFEPVARFSGSLIKLVPTEWGPPTFEIDGIKMLPTAKVSPLADARRKVGLVAPRSKRILDTCGGLGYFGRACLEDGAASILSFEKNPDVLWLRTRNPWSPGSPWFEADLTPLSVVSGDVALEATHLADHAFEGILHDPPRFGIAGELYSQGFYGELFRVLVPAGRLFHYVGTPNRLTSGRDVPAEVAARLKRAGFHVEFNGDGLLATKPGSRARRRG